MARHSSDLRFCSCPYCKSGRRHYAWGKEIVRQARRRSRRNWKAAIRNGDYDAATARTGVPYTD